MATVQEGGFRRLEMRRVSRSYGKTTALSDLDLELARGEFVALLGPSGCGKSTALACLAGLQPLSSGSIWQDDRRIDSLPPEKRGFGMVFQNYALFPHLTVQRNVEFGLAMKREPKSSRQQRAIKALEGVQLSEHARKLPSQLSGGQQQRVAIARALVIEPEVILMDEPLSNLDAALRVEVRMEIKRLYQERDLTVLYVTHDQEEALSLATRLVVLRNGKLEQTGSPEKIYTHPLSAYVASFMGYRNLFPGKVTTESSVRGVAVAICDFHLNGTVQSPTPLRDGADVVVAVRPEDLVVGTAHQENSVTVLTEVVEYHGKELSVRARTPAGAVLFFKTDQAVLPGKSMSVSVPVDRVLVFPAVDNTASAAQAEG